MVTDLQVVDLMATDLLGMGIMGMDHPQTGLMAMVLLELDRPVTLL